ncbi:PD-(D/E)XK nuclease-like domain-containing protein [Sharpea azabuensis]|uniref:PD-(D/E)XK nuclease-like domain-containing protein n=1 Tax=Sharpea azabuensis TaxID=322505 RepID=UPI001567CDF9|nr:PD-(D/E)XK nuclease-like domain-containing protein [Sharpea azabuensis]
MNNSTENYYSDFTRISNSNIGWFLNKGPAYLHKMLTDPVEEKNPILERGTMIHEYLLQPEEFQKDYVIWTAAKPSSVQQKTFCEELANSLEIEPDKAILSAYKSAYSTRGKTGDLMLSEGQEMALKLKDYISFLKSNDTRIMVMPSELKMLEKIKQNIQVHKAANKLLLDPNAKHEFHINWEHEGVKCKSLLDSLSLDRENKVCTIMDLKTTAKLWHFEESMEMYDYLRQLCYYTMAVSWYLSKELDEDPNEWKIEWYIIGIDTTGTNEIRVFKFNVEQVESRYETIVKALDDIFWHQQHDLWEHSRKYYEGDGAEKLTLKD